MVRQLPDGGSRYEEILSVNGDHFIYARNRKEDLPMADSLADLITKSNASREQILEFLDCEVSHGFVQGGLKPWEIQFSTLPYKTGQALEFVNQIYVNPETGCVEYRGKGDPDLVCSIVVNTLAVEDLLVLFPSKPELVGGQC